MQLINIDAFRVISEVKLMGQTYEVYGVSIGDFVDGRFEKLSSMDEGQDHANQIKEMLEVLTEYTNIPADKLRKLNAQALFALIMAVQGIDVTKPKPVTEGAEDAGEDPKNA